MEPNQRYANSRAEPTPSRQSKSSQLADNVRASLRGCMKALRPFSLIMNLRKTLEINLSLASGINASFAQVVAGRRVAYAMAKKQ